MSKSIVVDHVEPSADPSQNAQAPEEQHASSDASPDDRIAELEAQNAELKSRNGELRNEVGTWRRTAEHLTSAQQAAATATAPQDDPEPITSDQLLENPEAAIGSIVERSLQKALAPLEERLGASQMTTMEAELARTHPNYDAVAQSQKFRDWTGKSSARVRLAREAAAGDLDAARDLLDMFGALNPGDEQGSQPTEPKDTTPSTPADSARKAASVKPGSGAVQQQKRIWHANEIVDMKINDPAKYEREYPEIELALKEKRVRGL